MGSYATSPRSLPEHQRPASSYPQTILPASSLMEVQPSIPTPGFAPQPLHPLTNEPMSLEVISNSHNSNDSSNNIYYRYNSAIGGQPHQQAAVMKIPKINNLPPSPLPRFYNHGYYPPSSHSFSPPAAHPSAFVDQRPYAHPDRYIATTTTTSSTTTTTTTDTSNCRQHQQDHRHLAAAVRGSGYRGAATEATNYRQEGANGGGGFYAVDVRSTTTAVAAAAAAAIPTWNPSSVNGGPDLVFASDGTSPLPPPSCPSSSPGQSSVLDPHYHQPRSLYGFTSADPNYTHRIDSPIPTSIGKVPLENDNNASNNHLMPSLDGKARHSHQQLGYSADRDDTQSQRNKAASSAVRREQRRQGGSDGAGGRDGAALHPNPHPLLPRQQVLDSHFTPRSRRSFQRSERTSRFRGVTRHRRSGKWEAHGWSPELRKQIYLGSFADEIRGAEAHDIFAIKCKGDEAMTNFPKNSWSKNLYRYLDSLSPEELSLALRRQCTGFTRGGSRFRGVVRKRRTREGNNDDENGEEEMREEEGGRRWEACMESNNNRHLIGSYTEEEDAARAYDRELVLLNGSRAVTNFPLDMYQAELARFEEHN